jgi:hypothetical protein
MAISDTSLIAGVGVIIAGAVGLVVSLLIDIASLLGRCELHLRAQHVQLLGPLVDHSPDVMAERRRELGLDRDRGRFWLFTPVVVILLILAWLRNCG